MALPLPLLLLAGAAVLLMGRSGDDDDGDSGGDDGGDGNGEALLLPATTTKVEVVNETVAFSTLDTSDKYGTAISGGLGIKSNPIKYTGSIAIIGAPVVQRTYVEGMFMNQNFHLEGAGNEWLVIEDLIDVWKQFAWMHPDTNEPHDPTKGIMDRDKDYYPGNERLIIINKGSSAPGLFSIDWSTGAAGIATNSGTLWFEGE